jgi:hypothetical protein
MGFKDVLDLQAFSLGEAQVDLAVPAWVYDSCLITGTYEIGDMGQAFRSYTFKYHLKILLTLYDSSGNTLVYEMMSFYILQNYPEVRSWNDL